MPVQLICPNLRCRKFLSVPDDVRGKLVKCQPMSRQFRGDIETYIADFMHMHEAFGADCGIFAGPGNDVLEFYLGGAVADRRHVGDVVGDGGEALLERHLRGKGDVESVLHG